MSHKLLDRAKEYTSTQGLGAFTLAGPVAGCISICDATLGLQNDGDTTWLCAENGTEWEVFLATRTNSTTIARSGTITSSNNGNPVNFTAPPVVFGTVPASKLSTVGPSVSAYRATSNQTLSSGVFTKVQLNGELFDTSNCFDSTTNFRFRPDVAGYYLCSGSIYYSGSGITSISGAIYKNGVIEVQAPWTTPGASTGGVVSVTRLIYMNGTTDYLELWAQGVGTTVSVIYGSPSTSFTANLSFLSGQPMLAPVQAPGPAFSAFRSGSNQSIPSASWTKIQLNSETFDTANCFDSTTNYRFQPNVEGYYQVSFAVYTHAAGGTAAQAAVLKNGTQVARGNFSASVSGGSESSGSKLIYMNGATDYLELWGYANGSTPAVLIDDPLTFMSAQLAQLPSVPVPTTGPAFSAYLSADQSIPSATFTKAALNAEEFDTHNCFDSTTNYRFTPNVAGYYRISWIVRVTVTSAGLSIFLGSLYKNGTEFKRVQQTMTSGGASLLEGTAAGSCLVYMNGTTDYLELYGYGYGAGPKIGGTAVYTNFSGEFVRA